MSIKINNISRLKKYTTFTYNLFFEMILLLNLLTNRQYFSHQEWILGLKKRLSNKSLDTIAFWGSFNGWFFLLDIMTKKDLMTLNSTSIFLNFLQELPYQTVLDSLWSKPALWQEENEKEYRFTDTKNYDELLASPQELVEDLKSFLLDFYHSYFKDISQTIELALIQDINAKFKFFARHGLTGLLPQLSKRCSTEKDTFIIDCWPEMTFEAGRNLKQIILVPQIFHSPYLLINFKSLQDRLFICYPLQESPFIGQYDISNEEIDYLAGIFHILSEPTRLRILLSLYNEPAGCTELAQKLSLSKPTISRHLSRMGEYHFISGKEIENNRILYRISQNRTIDLLKDFGFFPATKANFN